MKINFNDNWQFCKFGEDLSKTVDLPHDAMLYEKRDKNSKNGSTTSWFPGGKYVYEKKLFVPKGYCEKCVYIEFEGVYRKADIYINEEFVLHHSYGYTGFIVPCDNLLYGKENSIKVIADNSLEPNSRWYTGSGIYRPVWLYVKNKDHISDLRIKTVSLDPTVINISCSHANATVKILFREVEVYNGNIGDIEITNAKLWSAETPDLYTCIVSIPDDEMKTDFGIRLLTWSSDEGLCINGKAVKLRGSCVHHDNGILGACAFDDAEERKVRILKECGYNAVRCAHNPCSEAFLKACDKYGIYVMDEAFDQWFIPKNRFDYAKDFEENYISDLKSMVKKDVNHPSVIMYSIGNEISETQQERGVSLTKEMTEYVRSLDPTRPVTCGINLFLNGLVSMGLGIYKEEGESVAEKATTGNSAKGLGLVGSAFYNNLMSHLPAIKNVVSKAAFADKATKEAFSNFDICGYNYGGGRYIMDGKKYPERIIVGSEAYIPDLYDNWKKIVSNDYLVGEFLWTGWDYLGEAAVGCWTYDGLGGVMSSYPYILSGSGAIDILGNPGCEQKYIETAFGTSKKISIGVRPLNCSGKKVYKSPWRMTDAVESWSWDGFEGNKAEVEVYSDDYIVKLFLNGKETGKAKSKKGVARFTIPYEKGVLTAVSYDRKGKETGKTELRSAGKEKQLMLTAEKDKIKADGQSLLYLNISVTDEEGTVKVLENKRIKVSLQGEGRLIAAGSAAPLNEESYTSSECALYYGKALAIIRSTKNKGEIKVTVECENLESKSITVKTE